MIINLWKYLTEINKPILDQYVDIIEKRWQTWQEVRWHVNQIIDEQISQIISGDIKLCPTFIIDSNKFSNAVGFHLSKAIQANWFILKDNAYKTPMDLLQEDIYK